MTHRPDYFESRERNKTEVMGTDCRTQNRLLHQRWQSAFAAIHDTNEWMRLHLALKLISLKVPFGHVMGLIVARGHLPSDSYNAPRRETARAKFSRGHPPPRHMHDVDYSQAIRQVWRTFQVDQLSSFDRYNLAHVLHEQPRRRQRRTRRKWWVKYFRKRGSRRRQTPPPVWCCPPGE